MSAKRWVALVAAAVLFLGMVYAVARFGGAGTVGGPGPYEEVLLQGEGLDKIAVIDVEGQIVENGDPTTQAVAQELVAQLRQAGEDPFVRAVILRVNSPGGSVVASDEIYNQVLDLKRAGKPVVASFGEVAASGGYYVSAGASRIVSDPSSFTGSIGVILVLLNLEEAAGNLGIEPVVVKSGRLKDIGQPYTGQQALDAGLVDTLGGFDRAVQVAERLADLEGASVVEYQPRITFEQLLGGSLPGVRSAVEEIEDRVGVTGPVLKYLYVT
jgi:protease-4